jgi:predicted RNase H-like HicB family nuclease
MKRLLLHSMKRLLLDENIDQALKELFANEIASLHSVLTSSVKGAFVMKLTAVFEKVPEGYIAFIEELPGANAQAQTLEEARENLREAVELVLEANRALAEGSLGNRQVIKEAFSTSR